LPAIANLVRWHNYAGSRPVENWYDDGTDFIAFSRGDRGWIAINNEDAAKTVTVATGLPAGSYCDVIHDTSFRGTCTGAGIAVDGAGNATVTVPATDTVAFTRQNLIHE
jgi:alpha-amylase